MKKKLRLTLGAAAFCGALLLGSTVQGDEFTQSDVDHYMEEYKSVVTTGRALWVDGNLGTNGVACAQCHPNAANTHPETYPKYQKQIGKVITIGEMINWCIQNPLEGEPMELDDARMTAMQAYILWERRGVKLSPGQH